MLDRVQAYGIANLYYEFLQGTRVIVADSSFASRNARLWGGIGIGGSYNWDDDRYAVFGEGSVNTSLSEFGNSYGYTATLGFRAKW
jgi:outer membrane autotransporter protein